jgi:perosamine synthetase
LTIEEGRVCWFVYVIRLEGRDAVYERLNARGIGCGRYFAPLHRQPLFAPYAIGCELPVTDRVSDRTLALPFFNQLTEDQVAEVIAGVST